MIDKTESSSGRKEHFLYPTRQPEGETLRLISFIMKIAKRMARGISIALLAAASDD
jgi:hypothetical protein